MARDDIMRWERFRTMGHWRFAFRFGTIAFGLPMFLFAEFVLHAFANVFELLLGAVVWGLCGLGLGWIMWHPLVGRQPPPVAHKSDHTVT